MVVLRKAKAGDFEKVYPLLLELNNPKISKEHWKRLFINHFGGQEDYFGYVLVDQDKIIGFAGLIFSERIINGKVQKFCNMTSWIIKKEHRGKGLGSLLLSEIIKLKDYTITALTATGTINMYKKHGFKELETSFKIIPPVPTLHSFSGKYKLEFDNHSIKDCLNSRDLKIYNDHLKFKCINLIIKSDKGYCYIILNRIRTKKLPFAQIHYISDLNIFLEAINYIRLKLCLHLSVFGLWIEERFLRKQVIKYSFVSKFPYPSKLFKSDLLDKESITDNLYTELLALNI